MVKYIHGSDCHDGKRLPLPSETTTVIMIESIIKTVLMYAVILIGIRLKLVVGNFAKNGKRCEAKSTKRSFASNYKFVTFYAKLRYTL